MPGYIHRTMVTTLSPFSAGLLLCLSLIVAIGPQNAHVLRMGLQGRHVWLTVAMCALADVALIMLGVQGLARLGGLSDKVHGALLGAGILFLLFYGWQALQRCLHPQGLHAAQGAQPVTKRQALFMALGFSWLNPHAWIDTAVLIGTASLAYGAGATVFGWGAATASLLWFVLLGLGAQWVGKRLQSPQVWRVLDGLVALMMWGMAAGLAVSLL